MTEKSYDLMRSEEEELLQQTEMSVFQSKKHM